MEENKVRGPDLEKYLEGRHHNYITYAQGARRDMGGRILVNVQVLNQYIEDMFAE